MASITLADVPRAWRAMTQTGLTDLARQRLEVISFFLLGLLACAGVFRWVWNSVRNDFPALPRLSWARALGMIVLWGLLFVLILTMISGARELMTPGAWDKKGLTYQLVRPAPPPIEAEITARVEAIRHLGDTLVAYARNHGGVFPTTDAVALMDKPLWRLPLAVGGRYHYVHGRRIPSSESPSAPSPLSYEPESVGPDRLVLLTDGTIQWMPASEIERLLSSKEL
jgi:hypothetical protein